MIRAAVVGAAAAAGLVAGVAIAYAVGGAHRAVSSLVVQRGETPVAAPTVAARVHAASGGTSCGTGCSA